MTLTALSRLERDGTRQDLDAFWQAYQDVTEDVQDALREDFADDPVLGPLMATVGEDDPAAEETRALMRRAFSEGDWEPYLQSLRAQGQAYGELGVDYSTWYVIVSQFRSILASRLVEVHGDDPAQLASAIRGMGAFVDMALQTIGESFLESRQEMIAKQQLAIAELSTPVLRLRPGMLLLPIVGVLDTHRSRQLTEQLLESISSVRAKVVVMDITGVAEVDTEVANRLVQTAAAARLMGATPIVTGVSAGVAQTLVSLGVDLKGLQTIGDLQGGVEAANDLLGIQVIDTDAGTRKA